MDPLLPRQKPKSSVCSAAVARKSIRDGEGRGVFRGRGRSARQQQVCESGRHRRRRRRRKKKEGRETVRLHPNRGEKIEREGEKILLFLLRVCPCVSPAQGVGGGCGCPAVSVCLASGSAVCEQGRVAYRCGEMQMEERGRGRVPGSTESETSGRERLVCC